jgi:hypothetical protein
MMEQLATVMYLYKDVPDVEFLTNPRDHPIQCNAGLPVLQHSVFNLTSPSTGETMDVEPLHMVCARSRVCRGSSSLAA